jgi:hypothetical protein
MGGLISAYYQPQGGEERGPGANLVGRERPSLEPCSHQPSVNSPLVGASLPVTSFINKSRP